MTLHKKRRDARYDNRIVARTSIKEQKTIVKLAKRYAGGNVSTWVRLAALNFRPK